MQRRENGAVEVRVSRVVSSLENGVGHGWGEGVLVKDRRVQVSFLLLQPDFRRLRRRLLGGEDDVTFRVRLEDVTAVHSVRNGAPPGPAGSSGAGP